jgi:hypothetical protein
MVDVLRRALGEVLARHREHVIVTAFGVISMGAPCLG